VAEGLVRLLHPFKYQHVYIPIIPQGLADYLEVRETDYMPVQGNRQYLQACQLVCAYVAFVFNSRVTAAAAAASPASCCHACPTKAHLVVLVIAAGIDCLADMHAQAPTPFLMGIHASQYVEPRVLETLVVADLDADLLSYPNDDSLMQRCLSHPYMQQLLARVR
jgi:hypothetical protein